MLNLNRDRSFDAGLIKLNSSWLIFDIFVVLFIVLFVGYSENSANDHSHLFAQRRASYSKNSAAFNWASKHCSKGSAGKSNLHSILPLIPAYARATRTFASIPKFGCTENSIFPFGVIVFSNTFSLSPALSEPIISNLAYNGKHKG